MTHKKVPAVQLLIIAMLYQDRAKRRVRHRLIPQQSRVFTRLCCIWRADSVTLCV